MLTNDGHVHVISTTPASGKTVITTGLIRLLREQGKSVLPFKPVAETELQNGAPILSEAVNHQCFAADAAYRPEISPVRVIPVGREADVWLFNDYLGRVPRLGRDMPVLASLPAGERAAIVEALERCRLTLLERCQVLVSEGSGAATAQIELGLDDYANREISLVASEVLLVARASNGTAFSSTQRVIECLQAQSVVVTGFLLNDVAGCINEHDWAARRLAARTTVPYVGMMPWTEFFDARPKYDPPSDGCDEDHRHLAHLVGGLIHSKKVIV